MLSSKHLPEMREHTSRTERKMKPTANIDYTQNMNGVDLSDQMMSYAPMARKTMKWWKKVAFHLLTLATVQAQCLYNKHQKNLGRPTLSMTRFSKQVAKGLAEASGCRVNQETGAAAAPQVQDDCRLTGRHFMDNIVSENGKKIQRGCVVCRAKAVKAGVSVKDRRNKRKVTHFQCKTCKVALCAVPCFEDYHTKAKYDI